MYLLDTVTVSELRKGPRANPGVFAWQSRVSPYSLYLSAITILELETGILAKERLDPAQGAVLRTWFDSLVVPSFQGRVLPVDAEVAQRCARLHVPNRRPKADSLIAATALVHGMTVVTRNVADFQPMGCQLLNPWTSAFGTGVQP